MIEITKLTGQKYYINPNHIEIIEITPDTMITTTNGKKYYALENVEDIIKKIQEFYRSTFPLIRKADYNSPFVDENEKE